MFGADYASKAHLQEYISPTSLVVRQGKEEKYYTRDEMIKFLSSWMPEVRHIRDNGLLEQHQSQYVEDLLNSILSKGGIENVRHCFEERSKDITFTEHFFYYTGDLLSQDNEFSTSLLGENTMPEKSPISHL